ncbi:hypothetical protein HIM_06631 [Hirsutella minnesotensis 3608]|uniref:Carboxylic ester hydrolase n=1 Tax=Hirsutella minnesotensis 3608 TaxID=1043627 RepID=A0A0F7ZTZ3_9HYPO|nr:hypothetical protein HIM_06631 [Hirsutella minnesotensis 3608]
MQFALLPFALAAAASEAPTVTIDSGPIYGVATNLPNAIGPVNKFLGVPYAAPPERFSLPKRSVPWTSPRNSTAFQASCTQLLATSDVGPELDTLGDLFNSHAPESEDCLYINAFTPASAGPEDGRPVVVFIPGGGFQLGSGLLDLSGFAGYEDVVAFTFNYRTNIFGFPNTKELPVGERNLGLHDQRFALEWVQTNAKAFGGDPKKVTIWGESAGSLSVDAHMHNYADAQSPPFRASIMSSGQMSFGFLAGTGTADDTRGWETLAGAVGCTADDKLACMRNVSAKALIEGLVKTNATAVPIIDNVTVSATRAADWRQGRIVKVPVMMSTLAEEGRALISRNITMDEFFKVYLPEPLVNTTKREAILSFYRGKPTLKTDFDVAAAIYTDFIWQCPQQIVANISASIGVPVWRSYINASISDLLPEKFRFLGKFHGGDLILLFGSPSFEDNSSGLRYTPQLYTFAKYLRGVIGSFVRNPRGGPGWPAVGSAYAPFDVVALGDVGNEKSAGASPVDQALLDADCAIFSDILRSME